METAPIGHNNPPSPINPEKLIDVDALPGILLDNYGPLVERGAKLEAGIGRWIEQHFVSPPEGWNASKPWPTKVQIHDDADLKKTSDFLVQLARYAGGKSAASGEVNEAREKVKRAPFDACKVIDAWFNERREKIRTQMVLMDDASTTYLRAKADAERAERLRQAAKAEAKARQAAEEAKRLRGDDDAVAAALQAEEEADRAALAATAPRQDMVRSTSIGGTTTTLRSNWQFRVTDMMALVKAVAAGTVSIDYLTTNDSMIRAAIKSGGRREIAGLEIYDDARASRTGRV